MNSSGFIVSNTIWKFLERFLAQLISLLVSILLARLLLPSDFGAISMVTVFIAIANAFVTSGIPNALIQKKDADETDFSSVFYFNLVLALLIYAALYFCAPFISNYYKLPELTLVIKVMGIRIIIASYNSVQHSYVSRHMEFKKYFWSTLFGTVFSGFVGIYLAYKGFGVWSLVWQYMTNTTIDTIVLSITVKWKPRLLFSWNKLKQLISYGWKVLIEGVSEVLTREVQSLLIGRVYTTSDLGFYTKGKQFPQLIVSNISISVGSVLLPAMSNEQDNEQRVLAILRKTVRVTSYVVFPMLTGLAIAADSFIKVILTPDWLGSVPYLRIFCLISASTVGLVARHQALLARGRSDVYMIEHIVYRVMTLVLLLVLYKISVIAIAISVLMGYVVLTVTVMITSKVYNNYAYKDQITDSLPSLIGCILMSIPIYLIRFLPIPSIAILLLQICTGVAVYILYSVIFHIEEFNFVIFYIKSVINKVRGRRKA